MAHDIKEALCILKPHGLSTVGSDTGWEDKAQCLHVCSTQASALRHHQEGGHVHHQPLKQIITKTAASFLTHLLEESWELLSHLFLKLRISSK